MLTLHISLTFCICEQTNLQAKQIMWDTRWYMVLSLQENLFVLKLNSDLWDIKTMDSIIKRMDASYLISGGCSGGVISMLR